MKVLINSFDGGIFLFGQNVIDCVKFHRYFVLWCLVPAVYGGACMLGIGF